MKNYSKGHGKECDALKDRINVIFVERLARMKNVINFSKKPIFTRCKVRKQHMAGAANSSPENNNNIQGNQRNKPVGVKATYMQDALNSIKKHSFISIRVLENQLFIQEIIIIMYTDVFTGLNNFQVAQPGLNNFHGSPARQN